MQLQNGRYLPLKQRFSPNYSKRPYDLINLLVIHNISLPLGQFGTGYIDDLFMGCIDTNAEPGFDTLEGLKVAPHFFIDRHGSTTQYVATNQGAWHAGYSTFDGQGNCNDFSLGVELEGTDDEPYTDAQYESLTQLICQLMQDFPLIKKERIVGHCDISPDRKTDPGASFDWARLLDNL